MVIRLDALARNAITNSNDIYAEGVYKPHFI